MLGPANREGFHTLTAYVMAVDADAVVTFLQEAFRAEVTYRTIGGAGGHHVELQVGDTRVMVGGGNDTVGDPTRSAFFLYVDDVDGVHDAAVAAGAETMIPPSDGEFEEERGAGVTDPFGNMWFLGRHGPASTST